MKKSVVVLKAEVDAIQAKKASVASFQKLVERYRDITELTAEAAREIVRRVVVHEPVRPEGKKRSVLSQEVEVFFHHIDKYIPKD